MSVKVIRAMKWRKVWGGADDAGGREAVGDSRKLYHDNEVDSDVGGKRG